MKMCDVLHVCDEHSSCLVGRAVLNVTVYIDPDLVYNVL